MFYFIQIFTKHPFTLSNIHPYLSEWNIANKFMESKSKVIMNCPTLSIILIKLSDFIWINYSILDANVNRFVYLLPVITHWSYLTKMQHHHCSVISIKIIYYINMFKMNNIFGIKLKWKNNFCISVFNILLL